MNLLGGENKKAVYVVNGTWGEKAAAEARKYGEIIEAYDSKVLKKQNYIDILDQSEWQIDESAVYLHYTDNETITGLEYQQIPDSKGLILVSDMSSNFCSKPIDFSKYGLIYAGAQKNAGPAGVTVVLVREDLLNQEMKITPVTSSYAIAAKNKSMYNTPPTFNIYVMGIFMKYMNEKGGIEYWQKVSQQKSECLYEYIDQSGGFYKCPIKPHCRSRMNVVFTL